MALLGARLQAASNGKGGVVLIRGEPGIGKTRLLAEPTNLAHSTGWQILSGRAYDTEGMPPYLPFVDALRPYVRDCPLESLVGLLGRGAPEVALLLPDVCERLPDLPDSPPLSVEHQRYRLFERVTDFLRAIAAPTLAPQPPPDGTPRDRGLLLTLDDLRWADRPTCSS